MLKKMFRKVMTSILAVSLVVVQTPSLSVHAEGVVTDEVVAEEVLPEVTPIVEEEVIVPEDEEPVIEEVVEPSAVPTETPSAEPVVEEPVASESPSESPSPTSTGSEEENLEGTSATPTITPTPSATPENTDIEYPVFASSQVVNGIKVKCSADEGVIPKGAHLSVTSTSDDSASEVIDGVLSADEDVSSIQLFEIILYNDFGDKIQPNGTVKITFSGVNDSEADKLKVFYLNGDNAEEVASSDDTESITAELPHFSVYGLAGIGGAEYGQSDLTTYTVHFETNGGIAIEDLIIDEGGTVNEPYDPIYIGHEIEGWYIDEELISRFNFSTPITEDKTLYAKWNEANVTVTFDSNGGSEVASITVPKGTAIEEPVKPTREGHTFLGWSLNALAENDTYDNDAPFAYQSYFPLLINQDVTLYAHWSPVAKSDITINFETSGGTTVESVTISEGYGSSSQFWMNASTKDGFTFTGWYKDAECTDLFTAHTNCFFNYTNFYHNFYNQISTTNNYTITLYAGWSDDLCTVTYNLDGGSISSDNYRGNNVTSEQVVRDSKLHLPINVFKGSFEDNFSYTFCGWYKDAGFSEKWNESTDTVDTDITLYAKFVAREDGVFSSTVTLLLQIFDTLGNLLYTDTETYVNGDFSGETFTFADLLQYNTPFDDNVPNLIAKLLDANQLIIDVLIGDLTHTVRYQVPAYAPIYTVSFSSMGGSSVTSQAIVKGGKVTKPADPIYAGSNFLGWYTTSSYVTEWNFDTDTVQSDMRLYAKWSNQCNVYFIGWAGSDTPVSNTTVAYGSTVSAPSCPANIEVNGWYKDAGFSEEWNFDTDTVTALNTYIYADWQYKTYILTFDSKGGSSVPSQTIQYDEVASLPADPSKDGFHFTGWYTDEGCSEAYDWSSQAGFRGNKTLYAGWSVDVYEVTFESNGGTTVASKNAAYNTKITAPIEPIKTGFKFVAWYKDTELNDVWDFSTDTVDSNMTLYAKWQEAFLINCYDVLVAENTTNAEINTIISGLKNNAEYTHPKMIERRVRFSEYHVTDDIVRVGAISITGYTYVYGMFYEYGLIIENGHIVPGVRKVADWTTPFISVYRKNVTLPQPKPTEEPEEPSEPTEPEEPTPTPLPTPTPTTKPTPSPSPEHEDEPEEPSETSEPEDNSPKVIVVKDIVYDVNGTKREVDVVRDEKVVNTGDEYDYSANTKKYTYIETTQYSLPQEEHRLIVDDLYELLSSDRYQGRVEDSDVHLEFVYKRKF